MSEELLVSLIGISGAAIVVALVELVKRSLPDLGPRWYPLAAIACGVALNLAAAYLLGRRLDYAVLLGVLAGLVAGGLYSGTRAAVVEPIRTAQEEAARQKWMRKLHPPRG